MSHTGGEQEKPKEKSHANKNINYRSSIEKIRGLMR